MSSTRRLVALVCSAAALVAASFAMPASAATLKVACTGTSAMQGLGSTAGHHVPDELGKALGAGFEVKNFAVEGTTAISSVSTSYAATSQMKAALAYNPDVVLFWFGGNDSFKGTWDAHKGEFKADYTAMVRAFQALPSHPKTFLVRLWVFVDGPVQRTVLDKEILPIIDQMAVDTGSILIDYRKAFEMHSEYFPDGMHPNDTGTAAIGKFFASSVTMGLAAGGDDAGAFLDAAGSDSSLRDADTAAPGAVDAAAMIEAAVPPVSMGMGGSAGASGSMSGGSSGTSGSASPSSTTTTTTTETPAMAASDGGGCQVSPRGGPVSLGAWFAIVVGLACARRRAFI